jgi:Cu-Zn family superoxide dismutase
MIRKALATCALVGAALGTLAIARAADPQPVLATAEMKDANGQPVGLVTLEEAPQGVLLTARLQNLPPGPHAFHIHEVGKCEPPFASAGGHFNPLKRKHGVKASYGHHAGDMPNLIVPASGALEVEVVLKGLTLRKGPKTSLFGPKGTAVIIHAAKDDYATDPTGNAGGRIACGVVVGH